MELVQPTLTHAHGRDDDGRQLVAAPLEFAQHIPARLIREIDVEQQEIRAGRSSRPRQPRPRLAASTTSMPRLVRLRTITRRSVSSSSTTRTRRNRGINVAFVSCFGQFQQYASPPSDTRLVALCAGLRRGAGQPSRWSACSSASSCARSTWPTSPCCTCWRSWPPRSLFGRGPAIFASFSSFLIFDWFFVEPHYQLTVTDPRSGSRCSSTC